LKEYGYTQGIYDKALSSITIKKIQQFKSIKQPTQSEVNLGQSLMLMMSSLDSTGIRLNHDKSHLLDKSWTTSIQKYLTNSGKVVQNLRKLKDIIDYERLTPNLT